MRTRPALFAAPLSCAFVRAPLTEETAQRSSATKRALILFDINFRMAVFSFLFRSLLWIDETWRLGNRWSSIHLSVVIVLWNRLSGLARTCCEGKNLSSYLPPKTTLPRPGHRGIAVDIVQDLKVQISL